MRRIRHGWMAHRTLGLGLTAFSIALLTHVRIAPAADDETYAERLTFDPKTGDWVEVAPPIAGTEDGDLELARSLLARGQYKKARADFERWFKTYPESSRWAESLFYAADVEVSAEEANPRAGDLMKAYRWYEELLESQHGTDLADRAVRRELEIAERFLFKGMKQKVWKGMLWLSAEEEGLMMLDRIIDEWAPQTAVAEKALWLKARYHYEHGDFEEAENAYAKLMRQFPRGHYHRTAMLRAGESALARFPGVAFDDADLLEAEVYFKDFQSQYPAHAGESQVPQMLERINESRAQKKFAIAKYYERADKPGAAIYYYRLVDRNWPESTWAAQARTRLAELGADENTEVDHATAYGEAIEDLPEDASETVAHQPEPEEQSP